jgi:hypothetical protein
MGKTFKDINKNNYNNNDGYNKEKKKHKDRKNVRKSFRVINTKEKTNDQ